MSDSSAGLVLVGHGSHLNPDSARPVFDHADRIRAVDAFREVREAFWKEEPSPREVLRTIAADEVYIVPVFMSAGYFTNDVLPREFRLTGNEPLDVDKAVHYADPVGTHPSMAAVIERRALAAIGDARRGDDVGLAIVGHGTDRNPDSARAARDQADRIRASEQFATVRTLFMDEEPSVAAVYDELPTQDIAVVPFFVADGYHTREDIPDLLGIGDETDRNRDGSWTVSGRRVWYTGAVGTAPLVAVVALERARDAGATVTNAIGRLRDGMAVPTP